MSDYLKEVAVFDNLLSKTEMNEIEDLVISPYLPYYFKKSSVNELHEISNNGYVDAQILNHIFIEKGNSNSNHVKYCIDLLDLFTSRTDFKISGIYRAQTNLMFKNSPNLPTIPHVDNKYNHHVLIYYVNESDGSTFLYNEGEEEISKKQTIKQEIDFVRGRFVLFPGNTYHSASFPQKYNTRVVFNYNLKLQ